MSLGKVRTVFKHGSGKFMADEGFTLIELLVTMVIAAILVSVAVPSFNDVIVRNRLRAAVEQMRSDLNFAKAEAGKRNRTVLVSFRRNGDGTWCYGFSETAACDCTVTVGANLCFLDRDAGNNPLRRVVEGTQFRGITMDALPFGGALRFSPVRQTVMAGNVSFTSSNAQTVRVVGSVMGRIRLCSPADADGNHLFYYDPC